MAVLVRTDIGAEVKNYRLPLLGFTLVLAAGCVSTVSEPGKLKAVVSNAETAPQAVEAAKQRATKQRKLFEQRQQVSEEFGTALRQPASVQQPISGDESEPEGVLSLGTLNDVTYSDLAPSVGRESQAGSTGSPGSAGGQLTESRVEIDTKGLPVLSGIRCLGIVSTKAGAARYMVKQEGQVAAVAASDNVLRVEGRGYRIRGAGADGVVVENGQGQSFLIRR